MDITMGIADDCGGRAIRQGEMGQVVLHARFANDEWRRFDMRAYLHHPAFAPLHDLTLLQRAHVQHGTVAWTDDIDLSPDTLYLRGQPCQG